MKAFQAGVSNVNREKKKNWIWRTLAKYIKADKTTDFKYTSEGGLRKIVEKVHDNWFVNNKFWINAKELKEDSVQWKQKWMFYDEWMNNNMSLLDLLPPNII